MGGNQSPPAGRSRRPPGEQKEISELHFEFDPHNRWFLRLRELYEAQNAAEYGCTDWSTIYSRSPSYVLQCDFCYMIGTDMFEEFVLHTLQRDCLALTNTLYHLDGEGELRHLDRLLSIPALKAVQWVPGAGKPNVIPVYTDDWGARRRHRQLLRAEAFLRPHHGKADGPPQNFRALDGCAVTAEEISDSRARVRFDVRLDLIFVREQRLLQIESLTGKGRSAYQFPPACVRTAIHDTIITGGAAESNLQRPLFLRNQ